MKPLTVLAILLSLCALPARADGPAVVADLPPVHSLLARVMQDVGTPKLLMPPGASPHGYSMRPSEASALAAADLVVWIGPALTPWLERSVEILAKGADSLVLLEVEGTQHLTFREQANFSLGKAADDHDHQPIDPHAWLNPANAKLWMQVEARALARRDPANAALYASNAAAGAAEIDALTGEIAQVIAPIRNAPFVVFHDAYQYFEAAFGLPAQAAIALGDGSDPSAARMAEIRDLIRAAGVACVFVEPQFATGLADRLIEGTGAKIATLDPLGTTLPLGAGLYPQILRNMAASLAKCLR